MADEKKRSPNASGHSSDEVIRIEDLTPRGDVKGGRKIILGEISGSDLDGSLPADPSSSGSE